MAARKTKTETPFIAAAVEATPAPVVAKPNYAQRFLASSYGQKLQAPITEGEKRMAISGTLTGLACVAAGPVLGSVIGIAATAADETATKDNWRGVGAVGAGSIATVAMGASTVAGACISMVSTGFGMAIQRMLKKDPQA